jgi:hypothetical protein
VQKRENLSKTGIVEKDKKWAAFLWERSAHLLTFGFACCMGQQLKQDK